MFPFVNARTRPPYPASCSADRAAPRSKPAALSAAYLSSIADIDGVSFRRGCQPRRYEEGGARETSERLNLAGDVCARADAEDPLSSIGPHEVPFHAPPSRTNSSTGAVPIGSGLISTVTSARTAWRHVGEPRRDRLGGVRGVAG